MPRGPESLLAPVDAIGRNEVKIDLAARATDERTDVSGTVGAIDRTADLQGHFRGIDVIDLKLALGPALDDAVKSGARTELTGDLPPCIANADVNRLATVTVNDF